MCHLGKGMHAGIRSAGTMQSGSRTGDLLECAFQVVLDGISMLLALPPGKVIAIVRDDQLKPLRHRN
jgi:hypothetical protein